MLGRSADEGLDKTALWFWTSRLEVRLELTTLSCKKFTVTETKSINDTTQTGETAVEAQMMLSGQSRREADRSHRRPK